MKDFYRKPAILNLEFAGFSFTKNFYFPKITKTARLKKSS